MAMGGAMGGGGMESVDVPCGASSNHRVRRETTRERTASVPRRTALPPPAFR